jgi:hypothetical protein
MILFYDEEGSEGTIIDNLADNAIDNYKPLNFYFLDDEVMVIEVEENDDENEWWTMFFLWYCKCV